MSYILSQPTDGWHTGNYANYFSIPQGETFVSASINGSTKIKITSSNLNTATQVIIKTFLTAPPNTDFTHIINGTAKIKNNSVSLIKVGDSGGGASIIGAGQTKIKSA